MIEVSLTVNGRRYTGTVEPRRLLSDFIRHDLGLTGTHVGCEHGVCGACTVMLDGSAVRSCLIFAVQAEGLEVATVESLANESTLHPLQQRFKENFALQCGFCTSGILMAAVDFVQRQAAPSRTEISEMLAGQLCRCTGYEPIIEAIHEYAHGDTGEDAR